METLWNVIVIVSKPPKYIIYNQHAALLLSFLKTLALDKAYWTNLKSVFILSNQSVKQKAIVDKHKLNIKYSI